jgi:crotonobetainyl-CoA:carnitine CoA-transferase CaiB-like acyl-CoA transferase
MQRQTRSGPLSGIKIVEFAGVGPGPMAAMLLADLGATVLRIDRKEPVDLGLKRPLNYQLLLRNRSSIVLDLKNRDAVELALQLLGGADALIEGFRPGTMERLGLGPDVCLLRNPRLVYGRVTGWGQTGPLAQTAGHDLNYIAITGALNALGHHGQPPTVPLNLLGDFAGGALYLAFGLLAGIIEARNSRKGQVVDAAIVDGVMSLQTSLLGMLAAGMLNPERGTNAIDSGSHFYNVYECADGRWVSVAPIEGRFHRELLSRLQVDPGEIGDHLDPLNWPKARAVLVRKFKTRTRDEWCALLEGSEACFAPVLSWEDARRHAHVAARETLIEIDGIVQPAPAPRFSRTVPGRPTPPKEITAENTRNALATWIDGEQIADLRADGVIE